MNLCDDPISYLLATLGDSLCDLQPLQPSLDLTASRLYVNSLRRRIADIVTSPDCTDATRNSLQDAITAVSLAESSVADARLSLVNAIIRTRDLLDTVQAAHPPV